MDKAVDVRLGEPKKKGRAKVAALISEPLRGAVGRKGMTWQLRDHWYIPPEVVQSPAPRT